ncbi:MAG: hypothetical protein E7477_05885 [Ruminococcaceae bacterium]|nr:hypothetical protein [Oscillospiraceae bacterium]
MFRIYLTEAFKNIKANITLSVIIVLLFTFLIQIVSYSFAWVTYHFWSDDLYNSGMINNEAYIEYSVYSIRQKSGSEYDPNVFISEVRGINHEDNSKIIIPLTEEEIAYNDSVIASYNKLSEQLDNIDGYIFADRKWGVFLFDNGSGYELSEQAKGRAINYGDNEYSIMNYTNIGYTIDEIRQFCTYNVVSMDLETILMEGFTYCEGEGFTEENLDFEYLIKEDGTLPTIPIVMGYDFREYFEIGDVLLNPDTQNEINMRNEGRSGPGFRDQQYARFVVVGFLEESTTLEHGPGVRSSVDQYIIIPQVPNTQKYFPNGYIKNQIQDFYRKIPNKLVYIEKENEVQTVEALSKAFSEDTVAGQYFYLDKNTQANKVYKQMYKDRMINYALIAGSTLIFCSTVIILVIINKFKRNIKDIAIHRLVGATIGDNIKSYILEFAIYLLCADILSHYVYIIYAFDRTSGVLSGFWMSMMIGGVRVRMMYPLMIAINILILLIVGLVAYICSSKIDTASIIKGKE